MVQGLQGEPRFIATVTPVSGSGCGRNVNTNEKISNVKQQEYSREIDVHTSKGTILFTFDTLGIIINAGFTPKTNEECISALGELLIGTPSQTVLDAPGPNPAYFNVGVGPRGYSESSKIENQYIIFKVSDIKDNESVKLMMYRNGVWIDLKTEKISIVNYKAYTQGFGSFAIVKSPTTASTTPSITPIISSLPTPSETTGQKPTNLALILAVILVIEIIVIYYLVLKK
jgi:PGF-pre-PGF domain-containing protein